MRFISRVAPWLVIAAAFAAAVYIPELGPERYTDLASLFRHERLRQASVGYSVVVCRSGAVIYQESFGVDGAGQALASDTPLYIGPAAEIFSGALRASLIVDSTLPDAGKTAVGEPLFDELLQSRITIPLGLYGTTASPESINGVAVGSGQFFGLAFPYAARIPEVTALTDGIVSTISDMAKFLAYLTAPATKSIGSLPRSAVRALFLPSPTGAEGTGNEATGSSAFGWKLGREDGRMIAFQGGSIEGFSSRVVVWPGNDAAIAILSAQGGALQSELVLPELSRAAGGIIFDGSSQKLFPLRRALIFAGFLFLFYASSLFLQTAGSYRWCKALQERTELGKGKLARRLVLGRTVAGLALRAALLALAPAVIGKFLGYTISYRFLLVQEPGMTTFFIIALAAGCLRNLARLVWVRHTARG